MDSEDPDRLRRRLNELAGRVAAATDADDRPAAHRILRELQAAIAAVEAQHELPAAPVLARQFARAHRRALAHTDCCARRLAARLPAAEGPELP